MFKPASAVLTLVALLAGACQPAASHPNANPSAAEASSGGAPNATVAQETAPAEECTDHRFVACPTSEACTMRAGKLIERQACFVRAADACRALACEHGCDIHHGAIGEPEMIHCAINAQSSGNMQRCAGYSNWACPEQMTCQGVDPNADDAMGTCVPNG